MKRSEKKLWLWLSIIALLTPIGIILPARFGSEGAWGEWGLDALERLLGYVPEGIRKTAGIWRAPIREYNFGGEEVLFSTKVISYLVSGIIGAVLVGLVIVIIARLVLKNEK